MTSTELSLPWRGHLARRPAAEREAWGRLAAAFEDQGLSWREAEEQAYREIEAARAAAFASRGVRGAGGYEASTTTFGRQGGALAASESASADIAQRSTPVKRVIERQGTLIGGDRR